MNIYVWGTGRLVGKVVGKYIDIKDVKAFIDNDRNKKFYMDKPVVHPEKLHNQDYDAIIVANLFRKEIQNQCMQLGINLDKVIFAYENYDIIDSNKNYDFVESVVGKKFSEVIKYRYHIVRGVDAYGNLCFENKNYYTNEGGGISLLTMSV